MRYPKQGDHVITKRGGHKGVVVQPGQHESIVQSAADGSRSFWQNDELKPLDMVQDPLVRAAKKAFKATKLYRLQQLIEEERRWKRKQTIARNKLDEVRDKIEAMATEMAKSEVQP